MNSESSETEALPPELVAIVEAMARRDARRDHEAEHRARAALEAISDRSSE
ncbi:MAG: hypothetical protein AB7V13_06255 [Pseudorhodoplanes sp.]|uniref:hypothetical protein n=1 Tax=Pseudorhodoplanes sp. TaxID=1934341 RepID=UPI003D12FBB3